jgi:hypothetical protein
MVVRIAAEQEARGAPGSARLSNTVAKEPASALQVERELAHVRLRDHV